MNKQTFKIRVGPIKGKMDNGARFKVRILEVKNKTAFITVEIKAPA